MHILSMERMLNFKSDNQPIDAQLVGIAEASKIRKEEDDIAHVIRIVLSL